MNMNEQLQNLRREYQQVSLDLTTNADPIDQCQIWLDEAIKAQMPDATAMVLSTANKQGQPSARVVLLKGIDDQQFIFYSHYQSHKALDMAENPQVALNFFWPLLERQIIIRGIVAPIAAAQSDAYFASRPRGSQIATYASHQSQAIDSREDLLKLYTVIDQQFAHQAIPRPQNWGGYGVKPTYIEFWQGRENRLHDRIAYSQHHNIWSITRLSP